MCFCEFMCTTCMWVHRKASECQICWNWSYRDCDLLDMRPEPGSSGRAVNTLEPESPLQSILLVI